ncbi:hypothetical protein D3C77_461230 [compost metagenome]
MAMEISQKILSTLNELEAVLRRHDEPGVNQSALRQVRSLCIGLKGHHAYITEKAGRIMSLADTYYSARRYLKYPGGPGALMAEMSFQLPNAIRGQVDYLDSLPMNQQDD